MSKKQEFKYSPWFGSYLDGKPTREGYYQCQCCNIFYWFSVKKRKFYIGRNSINPNGEILVSFWRGILK